MERKLNGKVDRQRTLQGEGATAFDKNEARMSGDNGLDLCQRGGGTAQARADRQARQDLGGISTERDHGIARTDRSFGAAGMMDRSGIHAEFGHATNHPETRLRGTLAEVIEATRSVQQRSRTGIITVHVEGLRG